jgi:hypothetical protein
MFDFSNKKVKEMRETEMSEMGNLKKIIYRQNKIFTDYTHSHGHQCQWNPPQSGGEMDSHWDDPITAQQRNERPGKGSRQKKKETKPPTGERDKCQQYEELDEDNTYQG